MNAFSNCGLINFYYIYILIFRKMKDGLYKFYLDCGRMGTVSGVFASNSSEIGKIIIQKLYNSSVAQGLRAVGLHPKGRIG